VAALRTEARTIARRLVYFWLVWSALLMVHELGHAVGHWRQGDIVRGITIGAGPSLWSGDAGATELELRLIPLFGVTRAAHRGKPPERDGWDEWKESSATILGGVGATLAAAATIAACVMLVERRTRKRWSLGRFIVADAIVLTLFNFLPVPPLDGGRLVLGAVAAWRGAPLDAQAMFWLQVGGLALAIVPMTVWTTWTRRIDATAMRWGVPQDNG
jgi:membrane-associated protease RseP (regulator of RpoE activity)